MVKEVKAPVKKPAKAKVIKVDTDKAINKIYELERDILELRTRLACAEKKAKDTGVKVDRYEIRLNGIVKSVQDILDRHFKRITEIKERITEIEGKFNGFNGVLSTQAKCNSLEAFVTNSDKELRERMMALEHTMKCLFNYKNFIGSTDPSLVNKVSNDLSEYYFTFDHICSLLCAKAELKYGVDSHEFKRIHLSVLELRGAFPDIEKSSVG